MRRPAPHTFDAKADAEGWLGRREEVVSGGWRPPVKVERVAALTFGAYSEQWLRERPLKPRDSRGVRAPCLAATCARCWGRWPST